MLDSFRKAEVIKVDGPQGGPSGHTYRIKQGGRIHDEEFGANQFARADKAAEDINDEGFAKNPRRAAVLAVAGVAVGAVLSGGGVFALTRSGDATPENSDLNAPAPVETTMVTVPTTEFTTITPSPEVRIKHVRVTVTAKPHHEHHQTSNVDHTPDAPTSSYTPAETYTPPAGDAASTSTPHHKPHLIRHPLHEH